MQSPFFDLGASAIGWAIGEPDLIVESIDTFLCPIPVVPGQL